MRSFTVPLLIGWFLGAASGLWFMHVLHTPAMHERHLHRMRERFLNQLKLAADQRDKVETALKETRTKLDALDAETRLREEQVRKATRLEIRALLNPDQQKTFDALNARREARRKKHLEENPHPWR